MKRTVIIEDELFDRIQLFLKDLTLSEFINLSIFEYLENHKEDSDLKYRLLHKKEDLKDNKEVW